MAQQTLEVGLPIHTSVSTNIDEVELSKQTFLKLYLEPKTASVAEDFRLIELKDVPPGPTVPPPMVIYFQPISIQDTFSNSVVESFLSQSVKVFAHAGQAMQMMGANAEQLFKNLQEKAHLTTESNSQIANFFKKAANYIVESLEGYRFDFPKVWQDSSMELTKEIRIYLRANPENDDDYKTHIIDPLKHLLKYVLPQPAVDDKQNNVLLNDHYKWPYFCSVNAPGLFSLPEAMVTNMVIDKGLGTVFGYNNRPGEVEVTIQFTPIRNVMINDDKVGSPMAYTLTKYLNNLTDKKDASFTSMNYNISTDATSTNNIIGSDLPTSNVTDEIQEQYDKLVETLSETFAEQLGESETNSAQIESFFSGLV